MSRCSSLDSTSQNPRNIFSCILEKFKEFFCRIPFNPEEAAELITKGKKIKMDLGYAETSKASKYFSTMLSMGFDADVIKNMTSAFKKNGGGLHISWRE